MTAEQRADQRALRGEAGARDLAITVGLVVALSRAVPDTFVWPIALVLLAGVVLGALQIVAEASPSAASAGVPVESLILPGAAALAALGAIRLVPIGLAIAPAIVLAGGLVGLAMVTELRIARSSGPPSSADRTAVLIEILVIGFLGFAGVASLVPGGLPVPGQGGGAIGQDGIAVLAQAGGDAIIGFLLAYRVAALRSSNLRDVAWFGLSGAAVVAIAAVALRSIEIPRILGPALLVLVFFLWDAIHSGGGSVRRRAPLRVWETLALVVLAIIVIGWSAGIRG
ncbi:MAG TPA: hypothetical protein VHL56_07730 [Candidatus Limnocylindrales bacterium]|jgi:hypothetical protein|nr:hypothetical protein [Candidatus Limnocylindrales bacterium]